jgi:hypothetical protein
VKRTKQLRLLLLGGGLAAGANSACSPSSAAAEEPRVSTESYYTNDHYIAGVGYYHAPFRAFFPHRYNHFDPSTRRYFYGGEWGAAPFQSAINISTPTAQAVASAEAARNASVRGGFGSTGGSHHVWS